MGKPLARSERLSAVNETLESKVGPGGKVAATTAAATVVVGNRCTVIRLGSLFLRSSTLTTVPLRRSSSVFIVLVVLAALQTRIHCDDRSGGVSTVYPTQPAQDAIPA